MEVIPKAGDVLAAKYRVERVLGSGGMGVVVEATHLQLDQRVALKFMTSELRDNESVLRRFEREARAAARLDGEHIARVFDFGELPDGAPYIVMEYLEGEDLSLMLDRESTLPVQRAIDLALQACVGVAEAHAAGIVHRDIKPANLFLARRKDGRTVLKVLDFGISKLTYGAQEAHLTQGHGTIGSPMYMSPEQIESLRSVDYRTDIWSLGAVVYELLTGYPPFVADVPAKVYVKVLTEDPKPLSEIRDDVPLGLEGAVQRALAKDLTNRHPTIADFAQALAPFGSKERAPILAASATRIIAASPLAHDALPVVAPSAPPPPDGAPSQVSTPKKPPHQVQTVELPASAHATTVASETDDDAPPTEETPSVSRSAEGIQKTSSAASWVREESSGRSKGPWVRIGAVVAGIAVLLLGYRAIRASDDPSGDSSAAAPSTSAAVLAEAPTQEDDPLPEEPAVSGAPSASASGEVVDDATPGDAGAPSTRPKPRPKAVRRAPRPKAPAASAEPKTSNTKQEAIFRYRE